jgi:hypothetical protein
MALWLNKITNQNAPTDVIKIHITEDMIDVNDTVITLEQLKARSDFRSFSRFVFPLRSNPDVTKARMMKDSLGGNHFFPLGMMPFEIFAASNVSKVSPYEYSRSTLLTNMMISLVFYPETQNMKQALLIVTEPRSPHTPLIITTTNADGEVIDYPVTKRLEAMSRTEFVPKCTLTCASDQVSSKGMEMTFTYLDIDGMPTTLSEPFEATVKTDAGYISHSKITVGADGTAKFTFMPLALNMGDKPTIQVGIGKYTDVASKTLTVV